MTTSYFLSNVENTLQKNLNIINNKITETKDNLYQNLETCLQDIRNVLHQVEENFLGPKSQTTQITASQIDAEAVSDTEGIHNVLSNTHITPTKDSPQADFEPSSQATQSSEPDQHLSEEAGVHPGHYPPAPSHTLNETQDHLFG